MLKYKKDLNDKFKNSFKHLIKCHLISKTKYFFVHFFIKTKPINVKVGLKTYENNFQTMFNFF